MSVAWVAVGASVVGTVVGASSSRSAASSASDASARATDAQAAATAERLAFDKQVYEEASGDRAFASQMARTTATNQAEDRTKYNALQDEQIARGRVFQAEEDKMLDSAKNYDNEGRRAIEVQKAQADVNAGFTNANQQSIRDQGRRGINLSGAASAEIGRKNRLSQALGLAGAATSATKAVEAQGLARKMDALGLGKGLVGNQATQAGLQLNAGNSSVQNAQVPISVARGMSGDLSQAYGNAASGFSNLAGTYNGIYNSAMQSGQNVSNAIGSIFNKPGVTSGISNSIQRWLTPQAGSSFGNGSVQGNSDYEYDL